MSTGRRTLRECPTCHNAMGQQSREMVYKGLGVWGTKTTYNEEVCPYCNWKGTTGQGAFLKELIKVTNNAPRGQHD